MGVGGCCAQGLTPEDFWMASRMCGWVSSIFRYYLRPSLPLPGRLL